MRRRLIVGAVLLLVVAGAAGLAVAAGRGGESPLTGATLERASAAALAHTGGGTVIESEAGDDGAAYGVEVRLPSGRVVEVSLDERFAVIGTEIDDDTREEPEDDDRD